MKKVYVAGLLWEEANRTKLEEIDQLCTSLGMKTYLPHRDGGIFREGMNSVPIFEKDRDMIDWCDVVVAVLDWKGIGSGTAWELGYAHAKKKPVIGLVEDKKSINKEFRTCVMCFNSVTLVEDIEEVKRLLLRS